MTIASPNLTLTITPPGGTATNYTQYLAWSGSDQQMALSQNFGRQGDTATIPLVEDYQATGTPSVLIKVLSQIKLVDNTAGKTLFAGVVTDPILHVTGVNRNEWQLQCTDYTFYADNAIVHGTFIGQTVDQIVIALTQQANCGITAATTLSGGFVAKGPQLASFVLNYTTLSAAWRKLALLAGQVTPYGWYVDENLNLHFYDATSAISSGVTFTTTLTTSGSQTEGHVLLDSQFAYEWDGTSVRNRVLVQGANQTIYHGDSSTTSPTDTWQGNGSQTSWPLRYILTGSPVLKINQVSTSVTIVGNGGQPPSSGWSIIQNNIGAYFLFNPSAPSGGVQIQIWYDYQIPIVAQANDYPSQSTYTGPNHGVYSEYILDTTLSTPPMALARAQRERTEYAFAAERMSFSTSEDWIGWIRAGETCVIVNRFIPDSHASYSIGINSTFIVIRNQVSFVQGGYRRMQVTAVRI